MTATWNGREWINKEKVHDARDVRFYRDEIWIVENFINRNSSGLQPSEAHELRRIVDKMRNLS